MRRRGFIAMIGGATVCSRKSCLLNSSGSLAIFGAIRSALL
jgi:hypothetical protein